MTVLTVDLQDRSYPIHIAPGLLKTSLAGVDGRRVVVVSNDVVAPLYLQCFTRSLQEGGAETMEIILPDGEAYKTRDSLDVIHDRMLEAHCDRSCVVAALGGGVIGDVAGFAAATYQRGVDFLQAPTTLLAMVDSSVGGKTGINHPRGKNMIGAFWQPRQVIADTTTLATLPERELSAGLAETIKYGLIRDPLFLDWLQENIERLLARDEEALAWAIERSCRNKAEVVAADELEASAHNGRALLNLGHTFGHAMETGLGYGRWLHGEAVAAGSVMAAELSRRLGWLDGAAVDGVKSLFARARLPICGPALGADRYLDLMRQDKKNSGGRIRLVLLKGLGEAVTSSDVAESEICAAITACCE